jgi:hypothetical protein
MCTMLVQDPMFFCNIATRTPETMGAEAINEASCWHAVFESVTPWPPQLKLEAMGIILAVLATRPPPITRLLDLQVRC